MRLAAFLIALTLGSPALAQDKLTLILDWFVNPDHGPIVIAEEKGFFAEQGLEVEVIAPADPSDPPKMAAAGKADIAVSYQPQLHLQVQEGLPLMRVGTLVAPTSVHHPAVLANRAATIDHISNGRFVLGLGAGWQINEHKDMADARGIDSVQNDGYATGAVNIHRDNIVGSQFRLNAQPDWKTLGATKAWAEEWQTTMEARFNLYADSLDCCRARRESYKNCEIG